MEIGCRPVLTVKKNKNKIKKKVEQIRKMKIELKIQCCVYKNYNKIRKMKINKNTVLYIMMMGDIIFLIIWKQGVGMFFNVEK